jgi:phosphoglycerate dehydrogenase-like enzyme
MPPSTGPHRQHHDRPPQIAVGPGDVPAWALDAVQRGGGQVVAPEVAEAVVWMDGRNSRDLRDMLQRAADAVWVQLPFAGIEPFAELLDTDRFWTCGKGVYAEPVAELAMSLGLAGLRGLSHYARAAEWSGPRGSNLQGANVTILGGGGIAQSLLRLLAPFDCRVTVVRNTVQAMEGAADVIGADRYVDALPGADLVVVALALTADTDGMLGLSEFEQMEPHAWVVNVARGAHIVTDHLVEALRDGLIGGAGLDVTDPEPLPAGHALWSLPNCIITPHVGNTPEMGAALLAERITANIRRFAQGEELLGPVDVGKGY